MLHLGARELLRTADSRQRIAELLRGEDAHALLLHGRSVLLRVRGLSSLALRALLRLDGLEGGLKIDISLYSHRCEELSSFANCRVSFSQAKN